MKKIVCFLILAFCASSAYSSELFNEILEKSEPVAGEKAEELRALANIAVKGKTIHAQNVAIGQNNLGDTLHVAQYDGDFLVLTFLDGKYRSIQVILKNDNVIDTSGAFEGIYFYSACFSHYYRWGQTFSTLNSQSITVY